MDRLMSKDLTTLLEFRLSETINKEPLTVNVQSLFDEGIKEYLNQVMDKIGAPNQKVAASLFIKRYAFLAVIALYSMSHFNRRLNVNPSNLILVSYHEDKQWLPKFYFKDLTFTSVKGSREHWREQYVKDIFANHLSILIDQVSEETHLSKLILWENTAVYLFWLYESLLAKGDKQIAEDFRYIFREAPGHVFGSYNQNPLTKYETKKVFKPATDHFIRPRKTCCFSYQLIENSKKCSTCPCVQLNEKHRAKK